MEGRVTSSGASPPPPHTHTQLQDTESAILRNYYRDNVSFMSAEGILKVLSVIVCIVSSMLYLTSGSCRGAPQLVSGASVLMLVSAALLACLYGGSALAITNYAPTAWLFCDIILSSGIGVTMFAAAVLGLALCAMEKGIDYVLPPLMTINASMVIASAVITYMTITKRWNTLHRTASHQTHNCNEQEA